MLIEYIKIKKNFCHILCQQLTALIQVADPEAELGTPDGPHVVG